MVPRHRSSRIPRRRIYDLRHTFASNALAAGVTSSVLAHYFGSSELMIDRTYSHLVAGSDDFLRDRLNAWTAEQTSGFGQDLATRDENR